ncbi:NAD(P)/FAD-dependent oxidoreductase [Devosia sp. 2618]|uniref:NAD(P)/FAD-dependent oxidoreductase n=1 Tax=Devosia sp. 2618 TaxID=3156454 RepID=UPI003395B45E
MSHHTKAAPASPFSTSTPSWVASGDPLDVVIVGGGQSGLAIAFALKLAGIDRIVVLDAAPRGGVGIWTTTARMQTLRTPKSIPGPELGHVALSFRSWFVGRFGEAEYDAIDLIPVRTWQDYLDWFQAELGIEVRYGHRVVGVEPGSLGVRLRVETTLGPHELISRKLVLATGIDGLGGPYIPDDILTRFAPEQYVHTADSVDYARFAGRDIGVVGGSASAFDAAATALQSGARSVHLLSRSRELAIASEGLVLPGFTPVQTLHHLHSDATRWDIVSTARRRGSVPARSVARAKAYANFHLHLGYGTDRLSQAQGGIGLSTNGGPVHLDNLIIGTGYRTDLALRSELATVLPATLLWKHCHIGPNSADAYWGEWPYLGSGLQLLPRDPHADGWVEAIHAYTYAAILSHGLHVGDIATAHIAVPRLVAAITSDLFRADQAVYAERALSGAHKLATLYAPTERAS